MTERPKRRWLRPALVVATVAALSALIVLAPGPSWHLVLVDLDAPAGDEPVALPRLEALQRAGVQVEWPEALPDRDAIEGLADRLAGRGWRVASFTDAAGSSTRAVTDAVLEGALDAGPASVRTALLVRYRPGGPAEADRELGRLVDGLASPLRPSQTLFVVVDRADRSVTLAGPRSLKAGAVPEPGPFVPWILDLLDAR